MEHNVVNRYASSLAQVSDLCRAITLYGLIIITHRTVVRRERSRLTNNKFFLFTIYNLGHPDCVYKIAVGQATNSGEYIPSR